MGVVRLDVPRRELADSTFSMSARGLPPLAELAIQVSLEQWMGKAWHGSFGATSDRRGGLDLGRTSLHGHATADPGALLWGLAPRDETPGVASSDPAVGRIRLGRDGAILAETGFERVFAADGVDHRVPDPPFSGALFLPPGPGPHPAVLTVSGSGGGVAVSEAALFASRGFACLALAYFNYPGRPRDLFEQPLEYFGDALEWLASRPDVRADAIAVRGVSRGGELSLLLGATYPRVRAVVAVVPSGYVWGGVTLDGREGSAWSWRGEPLPRIMSLRDPPVETDPGSRGTRLEGRFRSALAASPQSSTAAAEIPVEQTNGPILMLCGADDAMWDSVALTDVVLRRLGEHGFRHGCERAVYPDAGHALSLPQLPSVASTVHAVRRVRYALGGTPAGTARARVDAWDRTLRFLGAALGRVDKPSAVAENRPVGQPGLPTRPGESS